MKLEKLSINRFNIEKSIWYNRISLSTILDGLSVRFINKNINILGYQTSDAIGYPKEDREYVILFEYKDDPTQEYWFHTSNHFFILSGYTK